MENADGSFTCQWCAARFVRRHFTGRKPLYGTATHRQRAYEARRRGARYPNHPYPATIPTPREPPLRYEVGRHHWLRHALRPAGLPDRYGRRPALCGAWAVTIPTRFRFGDRLQHPEHYCRTCQSITQTHPAPRTIDPPTDLAVLTHLVSRLPPHPDHHDLFTYLGLETAAA